MNRRKSGRTLLGDSLFSGAAAGIATTLTAAACGELEEGECLAPLNAVSHIIWGDEAATHDEASWKYTATGLVLNTGAVISWAALYELLFGAAADEGDVLRALLGGAAISAIAYVVDYHVVPRRFTPGFEKRLSNQSMLGIYGALAVSLAVGSLLRARRAQ